MFTKKLSANVCDAEVVDVVVDAVIDTVVDAIASRFRLSSFIAFTVAANMVVVFICLNPFEPMLTASGIASSTSCAMKPK